MTLKQNKLFVLFLIIIIFGIVSFFTINHVTANIITVDDPTGDDIDNGLCSILEAFINVNNVNQTEPDCVAGSGNDVISIQTDILLDTILGTSGSGVPYALIMPGVIIEGNGHTIERDSLAPEFRIFDLTGNRDYEINDLTIKGADVDSSVNGFGGAMYIAAANSLTLNNVIFEDNRAISGAAIYLDVVTAPNTDIFINNSTFTRNISTGNGGALYLKNDLTSLNIDISESDFNNNSGLNGSSIFAENGTDVEINKTTFYEDIPGSNHVTYFINSNVNFTESFFHSSDNSAIEVEGSDLTIDKTSFDLMRASLDGGAVKSTSSNVDIVNSTFRRSLAFGGAGGAIYLNSAGNTLNVSYSTFLNNNTGGGVGGDIASGGVQTSGAVENNIFIQESGYLDICDGDFTNFTFLNNFYSHNDADCSIIANPVTNYGDVYENGGNVETMPLLLGSNAIDAGVAGTLGCPDTDARGVPRPFGVSCDVGAFEYTGEVEVIISETGGTTSVTEPNTNDTYTIVLGGNPSSPVTIDLVKSDSDFSVSPSSLTFTTLNWFTPRAITISPVDNSADDGDRARTITHTLNTIDANYTLLVPPVVNLTVIDEDGGSSSGGGGGSTPPTPRPGCMDSTALNYNSSATTSNGSCTYAPVEFPGCNDIEAINYDIRVTRNNGSCLYSPEIIFGCMDVTALNYNSSATTSNGLCTYSPVIVSGCMDNVALNYDQFATLSDGSCNYIIPVIEEPLGEEVAPEISEISYPNITTPGEFIKDFVYQFTGDVSVLLSFILGIVSEEKLQYATFAGIILPALIFIATQPAVLVSIPVRLWSVIPSLMGMKRKRRPWGTVYDSVTKQPLDPVYLVLENESGQEIATTISDIDGRFSFIVAPGRYKIKATKDNYEFPSKKLLGKNRDELYENLYFNEFIEIQNEDDLLIRNIPMDSLNFNWNEFEKSRNKDLMKFFSKTDLFLSGISNFVFVLGVLVSLVLVFASPSVLNFTILGFYYVIIFLRLLGIGPKKPGHVIDSNTKSPLSFGLIKLFSNNLHKETGHSVIGKTGRYHILVPNGEYYVQISKKTGEDVYEQIFTSESFKIHNGYLGKVFNVG